MSCDVKEMEIDVQEKNISVHVSVTSNQKVEQYNWHFSDGFSKATFSPSVDYAVAQGGKYSVEVEVVLDGGDKCYYEKAFEVEDSIFLQPYCDVDLAEVQIQNNEIKATATVDRLGNNTSFTWKTGDGYSISGSSSDFSYTYSDTGTYILTVIYENENCIDSASKSIEIRSQPDCFLEFDNSSAVNGKTVSVNMLATHDPTQTPTFEWDMGDGKQAFKTNNPYHVYSYSAPGVYIIKVTMHTLTCTVSNEYTVTIQ